MPKILLVLLSTIFYILIPVSLAHATSDPQSATADSTATVPSSTASYTDLNPPTIPILISPQDGTITTNNKPEFRWRASQDPDGNTVIYTLYLNNVATYLGISNLGNSTGPGYTARLDGDQVILNPTLPLSGNRYTWHVVASDLSQNSTRSTTWTFTIDNLAPVLTLLDLDTYHLPQLTTESNFDIAGPKDIHFTLQSEPFATIRLGLSGLTSDFVANLESTTDQAGFSYLYQHLVPGQYHVTLSASDQSGNTTVLPRFRLTITQATLTLPAFPGLTPALTLPYTPLALPSLPATIAKVQTRLSITTIFAILLAIAILILLIIIWRRRYYLILLNDRGQFLSNTKVYHSIPTQYQSHTPLLVTRHSPLSFDLTQSDRGRLYIPHLTRYSTLTTKTQTRTYILSLSARRKLYTIILD